MSKIYDSLWCCRCGKLRGDGGTWCWPCHEAIVKEIEDRRNLPVGGLSCTQEEFCQDHGTYFAEFCSAWTDKDDSIDDHEDINTRILGDCHV